MEEKSILAMYDVRGIQNYIFRTNKVKDIMGASKIVAGIIKKTLEKAAADLHTNDQEEAIIEWENQKEDNELLRFFEETKKVWMQVLFIGGGNAYVAYRRKEDYVEVNKKMTKMILEETYSLQLAVAMVEITESYTDDYNKLQKEMAKIKSKMPFTRTVGALPIVRQDLVTGFPITAKTKEGDYICKESYLKRKAFEDIKEGQEKIFDTLITEKGRESILAVVHIDGNNMGSRIRTLMERVETSGHSYTASVKRIREISYNINHTFEDAFDAMKEKLEQWVQSDKNKELDKKGIYLRKIIVGGDDITFVCNAKVALALVEFFTKEVNQKVLLGEAEGENLKENGFSTCAGIAYVNSHFPFSMAYEVAEACCGNAKKRAKDKENKDGNSVGNFVDFQICKNMQTSDLEVSRQKDYQLADGNYLLKRPYYISMPEAATELNQKNKKYNIEHFKTVFHHFSNKKEIPFSMAKDFRNKYSLGEDVMRACVVFAESRDKKMPKGFETPFADGIAQWYDALEMLDLYREVE